MSLPYVPTLRTSILVLTKLFLAYPHQHKNSKVGEMGAIRVAG